MSQLFPSCGMASFVVESQKKRMQFIILCKYPNSFKLNGDGNLFNSCLCKNLMPKVFIGSPRKNTKEEVLISLIYGELLAQVGNSFLKGGEGCTFSKQTVVHYCLHRPQIFHKTTLN